MFFGFIIFVNVLKYLDMDANTADSKKIQVPDIHLSCNVLKFIACVIMFIDHVAYGIIHNYMIAHAMDIMPETYTTLQDLYNFLDGVGRLAFPIFCFFIVEGFIRTRSVAKYALRLGLFAIVSEIPFDLGLYGVMFKWDHQNIILTFFIALIMLAVIRYLEENVAGLSRPVIVLAIISAVIGFADAAYLIPRDYSWKCMLLVAVLYLARNTGAFRLIAGAASVSWEKYAPISFVLLYFYDPSVKPKYKYAFYVFYPLHLILLYFVGRMII